MELVTDREAELRRTFLGPIRRKVPQLLLVSGGLLLACFGIFGSSGIVAAVVRGSWTRWVRMS